MLAIWLHPTGPHPNQPLTDNSFHYHPSSHLLYMTFPSTLEFPRWHLCGVPSPIPVQDHCKSSFEAVWVTATEPSLLIHSWCHGKVGFQLLTSSLPKNWWQGCSFFPVHDLTGDNHPLTCFFIPTICRWHPAITQVYNSQSHGNVSMDEGPPAPT